MSENEEWYDREIGPKLRELCGACNARGMAFLSAVEYAPNELALTYQSPSTAGLKFVMLQYCARTVPNVDSYVIGLIRYCREKGINTDESMIMRRFADNQNMKAQCRSGLSRDVREGSGIPTPADFCALITPRERGCP